MDLDKLLEITIQNEASDLHIRSGSPPKVRIRGKLRNLGNQELTPDDTARLAKGILSEKSTQELEELGSADFGLAFKDGNRFRVNVFKHQGSIGLVMRLIPNKLIPIEVIGLPEVVLELCMRPRGLFLVTGPTGSGKTTTLASMIDFINMNRSDHIITIEDPIEYTHKHKRCLVSQRELGADTTSFEEALRRALRQDPDIILVGEMRDLETISAAITAAETGHLVFGTLHTTSAAKTIDRIIDAFPTNQQEQIRTMLATAMLAVLSQQLLPTLDGKRCASYELMVINPAIAAMIRKNESFKINSTIQTSSDQGMILLDDHLFNLYTTGRCAFDEVLARANDVDMLEDKIKAFHAEMEKQQQGKGKKR